MVVGVIIQNGKIRTMNPAIRTINSTLRTQVDEKGAELQHFQIEPLVGFIRLLFTTSDVLVTYLDLVTADTERLTALISKS